MTTAENPSRPGPIPLGAMLTYGFGNAVLVWCGWWVTHLPYLKIPNDVSVPILLGLWAAGAVAAGLGAPPRRGWLVGAGLGLVTALVGLLILGSKLVEPQEASAAAGPVLPDAPVRVLGFLALGLAIGAVGGMIGNLLRPRKPWVDPDWLARFAVVASIAVAPLLFVGGLVTSTGSGMAVPDWPGTFGSNMFLYPLGSWADPQVYYEHTHRLFGTLVGLTAIVLTAWVLIADPRRWLKITTALALLLIIVQGILGGTRVTENSLFLAWIHGITGQLVLGMMVGIAVALSPTWKRFNAPDRPAILETDRLPLIARARFWGTGTLHATLMQLILGAAYRHFGGSHALWTHAAFAIIVVIFAVAAGFLFRSLRADYGGIGPVLRRVGLALLIIVVLQFLLGWGAFAHLGVANPQAGSAAVIRTLHQANGAALLAAAVLAFSWAKRLNRVLREAGITS